MAKVPDTHTFSLRDVVTIIYTANTLQECFDDSIDSYFDVAYKGSKDRLSNFRNYGPDPITELVLGTGTGNHRQLYAGGGTPASAALYDGLINDMATSPFITTQYTSRSTGDVGWQNESGGTVARPFLEFDTSVIPDTATILTAELRLYAKADWTPVSPGADPLDIRLSSSSGLSVGQEYFEGSYSTNDASWDESATTSSCGSFSVPSYAYSYYYITINTSVIRKQDKTWFIPRLYHWDYGYSVASGVPPDLRSINLDISKTSIYKPQLTITYST